MRKKIDKMFEELKVYSLGKILPTFLLNKIKRIEREMITYGTGHSRPWTIIESDTCRSHSNINIFFSSFCNFCYHFSTSRIYCLKFFSYFHIFILLNKYYYKRTNKYYFFSKTRAFQNSNGTKHRKIICLFSILLF